MQASDYTEFNTLLQAVTAMYGRDLTPALIGLYWQGLRIYALAAVREALHRHMNNPDTGQFMPKPADIHKMLQGSTQDAALLAWAKVDRAMREVGPCQSVVFDDPLIHRVLYEMGGWLALGSKTEDDWPFVGNEFVNRTRGYRMRSETPDYPPVMIGLYEAENRCNGYPVQAPVLIGDLDAAQQVMLGGTNKALISFTRMRQHIMSPIEARRKFA